MNDSDKSAKVDSEKEQKAGDWLKSNKMKLNNKQKKKIKEWSKLKAFEIIKNKIFSPVNLEKKFSHIQGNVELMIKDSDYQLIKSVISFSNHYTPELNAIELFLNEIKHAYHTNVFENRSVFIKIK